MAGSKLGNCTCVGVHYESRYAHETRIVLLDNKRYINSLRNFTCAFKVWRVSRQRALCSGIYAGSHKGIGGGNKLYRSETTIQQVRCFRPKFCVFSSKAWLVPWVLMCIFHLTTGSWPSCISELCSLWSVYTASIQIKHSIHLFPSLPSKLM